MIPEMVALIKQQEENGVYKPFMYKDSLGYNTIGYGRCLDKVPLSQSEADLMLANDLASAENDLKGRPWFDKLDTVRQSVLINMCFNMGLPHLLQFTHMIESMQVQDWVETKIAMLDSVWARQVGSRANVLAGIMLTDRFS
jgi:lysozyme